MAPLTNMSTGTHHIPDDPEMCDVCGTRAEWRTCDDCGLSARILDCGHMAQPRPIAAGRTDGSDLSHTYCEAHA